MLDCHLYQQAGHKWQQTAASGNKTAGSLDQLKKNTGWRTKCHTIDCARNTILSLQKHLTFGTELILIGWKIVPNEEHVQCDHRFAS